MGKSKSLAGRRKAHIATVKERLDYLTRRIDAATDTVGKTGYLKQERASLQDALQCMQTAPLEYARAPNLSPARPPPHPPCGADCERFAEYQARPWTGEFAAIPRCTAAHRKALGL